MQDKQRVWGFFAHASIIIGMMFVVFFVIDRFNPAMEFLTSGLSKWLMFILAVCAIFTGLFSAVFLFQKQKRRDEKRSHPQKKPAYETESVLQEWFAQPRFDPRANLQGQQLIGFVSNPENQPFQSRPVHDHAQEYPRYLSEQTRSDYERKDSFNK
jgi:hypothetical protein